MPPLNEMQIGVLEQGEEGLDASGHRLSGTYLADGLRDFRRLREAGLTVDEIIAVALLQIVTRLAEESGGCNYPG
jgi:hypothetical protein